MNSQPLLWRGEKEKLKAIYKFFLKLPEFFGVECIDKQKILILGSYSKETIPKWKVSPRQILELIKEHLNSKENVIAFLLEDVVEFFGEDLINKFYVLASAVNKILTIIESNEAGYIIGIGHILELGIIIAKKELAHKTTIYLRQRTKLSGMLDSAFVDHYFERNEKVFFFSNLDDLKAIIDSNVV